MKSINEYLVSEYLKNGIANIFESDETSTNEERREELENWLKGQNLHDYVETLNKMLEDPKAKTLLQDGFGGELADVKFKFKVKSIPVRNLRPTQSEIDIDKSIGYPLTKDPSNIDNYYSNGSKKVIVAGLPLITFRSNYIIDGHHRWSQVFAFNPDAEMLCCDYDANISPVAMLKATQGAIAAVKADDNEGKVPSQKVEEGRNIYDSKWNEENLVDLIEDLSKGNERKIVNAFRKVNDEMDSFDKVAEFVSENLLELKSNNYPESDSPSRAEMPQTDQGAPGIQNPSTPNEKKHSLPTEKGSALNKLKDGGVAKVAVK